MKKNALVIASILSFALLVSSNSFAQSTGDYVRNTTTVPDVTASGWNHESAKDTPMNNGVFMQEVYVNQDLTVLLTVRVSPREVLRMEFGKMSAVRAEVVARAALNVAGTWYVAKEPFVDGGVYKPENHFQMEQAKDSQGKVTSIKVSLETLEGLKSIVVSVK